MAVFPPVVAIQPVYMATDLILTVTIYHVGVINYNACSHSLARYPEAFLAWTTNLWHIRSSMRGTIAHDVLAAHERYGDAIRVAPDELSYISSAAWNDIYGHG